jgi:two-component system sensor kinase FixL
MFAYDHEITKSILGSSLDAVFTIQHDGVILDANDSAERMFGWPISELLGHNNSIIVASPHKKVHDAYLKDFKPRRGISHILGNGRLLQA